MGKLAGWGAILLVIFGAIIGIVPGAVSAMGFFATLLAVALSLFSIRKNGRRYFVVTIALAVATTLLLNDMLRIWQPIPMPSDLRAGLYGIALLALGVCCVAASRLDSNARRAS